MRRSSTSFEQELTRIAVGDAPPGWQRYDDLLTSPAAFTPDGETDADDPMLLYFTSGTTAKPKLVLHSHRSYPIGHLSTMYWLGLLPGDVHLNVSSPGWAKHAWSCFFAPWNAGATVCVFNQPRFDAKALLDGRRLARRHVAVRAADGVAHAHPGGPRSRRATACARSSRRASRSTPRSSTRSATPGA